MIYFYGGSFDPITYAHINIMKAIHKQLRDDDRFVVAVANNDEKNYTCTLDERFDMIHDTLLAKFKNNGPELMKQDKRTYAWLSEIFINQEKDITVCVGEDEWKSLLAGKWVNWDLLLKHYKFLVVGRENTTVDTKGYNATVINIEDSQDISSTKVRDILSRNPDCHYEDVKDYITHQTFRNIKENELYWQNGPDYEKNEKKFLADYAIKKVQNGWGEPSVTTDTVAYNGNQVLLIRRKNFPFKNHFALPGGFFEKTDEDLNYGAARELKEETGLDLDPNKFIQIRTYGHNFDPRMKIVDTAFAVRVPKNEMKKAIGSDDAAEARWFDLDDLPKLGFHHEQIIKDWLAKRED